jgi:hypothetical protein
MSDSLLPEVKVTELPTGARYRLPPRRLGLYHFVGLALLIFGLMLCSAPILPTWKVVQAMRGQIPADDGLLWLGACVLCALLCRAGLYVSPVGLFILSGHSEIELRGATLYAIECCGPVRWRWERSTADLRRFFVSEGLESLNLFGKLSIGPLGTLCVITPEWKAVVDGPKAKSMWLAPGYPRPWLVSLAEDLARRCASADPAAVLPSPATVPVLEQAPDFSDYEELAEQPAGSRITVEQSAESLRLIVPPGIRNSPGWYIAGGFLCMMAFALSTMFFEDDAVRDMPLWLNVLLFTGTGIGGISFILAQANLTRRRLELAVHGDALMVLQSNLFGAKQRQWRREHVADVFVIHHPDSEGPDHWELQIQPRPGEGDAFRLLAYQDVSELRWLATVLRQALRCRCDSKYSPAQGLVVRSPRLVLSSWGRENPG